MTIYAKKILLCLLLVGSMLAGKAQSSCLSLYVETASANTGDTVCLDIRADGFDGILGMQYSLRWNPQALRFTGLEHLGQLGLSASNFSLPADAVSDGFLALSWFDPLLQGVTKPDGSLLYSVCFELLDEGALLEPVRFSHTPTRIELVDAAMEALPAYSLIDGGVYTGAGQGPRIAAACTLVGNCQGTQSIDITMAPEQAGYDFQWIKGNRVVATEESLSGEIGGAYSLLVTDEQGATASGLFYLLPTGLPRVIDAEITDASCHTGNDGAIALDLNTTPQGLLLEWSNGATGSSLQGLAPGEYEVTISSLASGCSYKESYTLGLGSGPAIAATIRDADCNQNNGSITIETPAQPLSFAWGHGEASLSADSLAPGEYSLTVDFGQGCMTIQHFTVGQNDFVTLNTEASECLYSNDSYTVDVTAAVQYGGTPPFIFEWSNGQVDTSAQSSTLAGVAAGMPYSLTITDSHGCAQSAGPFSPQCEPPAPASLTIGELYSGTGKHICVPVKGASFEGVAALLASLQWNPNFLHLEGVEPGLLQQGFDLSRSHEGIFQLSLDNQGDPLSFSGERLLFELCFTVIAGPGQAIPIGFLQAPQAFGNNQLALPLNHNEGSVFVENNTAENTVALAIENGTVEAREAICLEITTSNFTDIAGAQFSLRWDPDTLTLDSILWDGALPLAGNNFNLQNTPTGRASFSWMDITLAGVSLPEEARLFTACFTAGPSIGRSHIFFSSVPTLIDFTDGEEALPVDISNGRIEVLPAAVRPGDTDQNRRANHYDLLNIGLAYGATGPQRPDASIIWEKQPAPGWEQATPSSLVNYKHIDTDGNGRIEAADTLAIVQNYGQEAEGLPPGRSTAVVMYVRPDTISPGQPAVFDIVLGEEAVPAEPVHGLAFTVVYDTSAVQAGSSRVVLRNSWLGILDDGLLLLQHDHPDQGRLDVAITRTDGIDVPGYGPLAQMYISIQDVIFRRTPNYELLFDIEKIRLINSREELAAVSGQQSASVVLGAVNNSRESRLGKKIRIYPNPTADMAYFNLAVERAELLSLDGRLLMAKRNVQELSIGQLPPGPYLLRFWREGQSAAYLLFRK